MVVFLPDKTLSNGTNAMNDKNGSGEGGKDNANNKPETMSRNLSVRNSFFCSGVFGSGLNRDNKFIELAQCLNFKMVSLK